MTCEMNNRIMEKYDNNGYLVYKGGYTGNVRDGFLANCRGQLFSYNGTVMMYDGDFIVIVYHTLLVSARMMIQMVCYWDLILSFVKWSRYLGYHPDKGDC